MPPLSNNRTAREKLADAVPSELEKGVLKKVEILRAFQGRHFYK
jgi:hypothetical protein